jgi:hypothetical protein
MLHQDGGVQYMWPLQLIHSSNCHSFSCNNPINYSLVWSSVSIEYALWCQQCNKVYTLTCLWPQVPHLNKYICLKYSIFFIPCLPFCKHVSLCVPIIILLDPKRKCNINYKYASEIIYRVPWYRHMISTLWQGVIHYSRSGQSTCFFHD